MSTTIRPRLTEQERAERRARDREYAQHAVEQLRNSDGWERWLRTRALFRTYSLGNQLLIAMQHPSAEQVAGFRAWLKLGYCVRKGETGIRIWANRALSHQMRPLDSAVSVRPGLLPLLLSVK